MDSEKKFKTKFGYCHILEEKIVIRNSGIRGNISKFIFNASMMRAQIFYFAFAVLATYFFVDAVRMGNVGLCILFGSFTLLYMYPVIVGHNYSATFEIKKRKIIRIEYKKGIPGLILARFVVHFETDEGKINKRIIALPGVFGENEVEAGKAIELFKSEGLMK
jgi:hypothetical protein